MRRLNATLAALMILAAGAAATDLAALLKVEGHVEIQIEAEGAWAPAGAGQVLADGQKLRTGRDGAAALIFLDDRSLLKLAEDTEVSFHGEREGRSVSKRVWMGAGQLWARVTRAEDPHFQVETPTSVASVKGSEFYSLEHPQRGNTLLALTGRYSYANGHGEIEVVGGETGRSDGKSPPHSRPTEPGEVPGFGGEDGGAEGQEIRIEFTDEEGDRRVLVLPLVWPEEDVR